MTASLVELLRKTLTRLEDSSHIRQDDPALLEIKSNLVLAIAELAKLRESEQERAAPVS